MKPKRNSSSKLKKSEITLEQLFDRQKLNKIRDYISEKSVLQSKEQLLLNELASIKYKIYDYIVNPVLERVCPNCLFTPFTVKSTDLSPS